MLLQFVDKIIDKYEIFCQTVTVVNIILIDKNIMTRDVNHENSFLKIILINKNK